MPESHSPVSTAAQKHITQKWRPSHSVHCSLFTDRDRENDNIQFSGGHSLQCGLCMSPETARCKSRSTCESVLPLYTPDIWR